MRTAVNEQLEKEKSMVNDLSLSSSNLINNLNDAGNKLIQNGAEGLNELKQIGEKAVEKGKAKINEMKQKGLGVWNFLKKAGVMLGTALGAVAGLAAAGVIAVTLPVSLPVLGAIAGGLFVGGTIATIVHNIKDPNVKGAKNVFIQTLKDVGSNMLMAIPTLIAFLNDPKKIGECVQSLKNTFEDAKKDISDLKNIVTEAGGELQDEAKKQFENLQNEVEKYKNQLNKLTKNSTEEAINALETSRSNILEIIGNLENEGKNLPNNFTEKLNSLKGKFNNEQLNRTFPKLNESFSEKPKKADKTLNDTLNLSEINFQDEIIDGNDLGKSMTKIFKNPEEIENNENSKNLSADHSVRIQKNGDYIPPTVELKPIQKNNLNGSLHQIFEAYNKVDWAKLSQNKLQASAVSGIQQRMETLKQSENNAEVLREQYPPTLALVKALCNYNPEDNKLTELKNALENFKIPSSPSVAVNEDIRNSVLDNNYHAFGEQLIGSVF